jgi:TolB protein
VAFASNRSGNWDIWVLDLDGGQPIQVTSGRGDEVHPSWSPDGDRLVFCSLPADGGQWELWVTDSTAGSTNKFIGYGLFPEWSPVGDTILYQRARERGSRWFSVWTLELVEGEPRYPTELAAGPGQAMILPAWSPDGQRIVFARTDAAGWNGVGAAESGALFDIWVMNADGRAKVRLTERHTSDYDPTFSSNGRVYFASNRTGYENIWSVMPTGAGNRKVTGTYPTAGFAGVKVPARASGGSDAVSQRPHMGKGRGTD